MNADVIEKDGYFYAACDPERYVAVPHDGGVDIAVSGVYTCEEARQVKEALWSAIWAAENAPYEVAAREVFGGWSNVRFFGRRVEPEADQVVFFRSTRRRGRTHVLDGAGVGNDGRPYVIGECGVDLRGDDAFEQVDGANAPFCERCAKGL